MTSEQVEDSAVAEESPRSFAAPEIPTASNTTLEYFDGFDDYIVDSLPLYWQSICANPFRLSDAVADGITISSAVFGRNNTSCLGFNRTSGWGVYKKGRLGSILTRTVGVAVRGASLFSTIYLITYFDGLSPQLALILPSDGFLRVATIDPTLGLADRVILANNTKKFPTSGYPYVEISVTFSSTNGSVRVNVDGETWMSGTGLNTVNTGNNPTSDGIALGMNLTIPGDNLNLDDFYMKGDGVFLGPHTRVITRLPSANGSVNQWTRSGFNSGANWSQVNDIAGFTLDYKTVNSRNNGDTDEYTYPTITSPLKVFGMMNCLVTRTDIAGRVEVTPTYNSAGPIYEGNPHTISVPNEWRSLADIQGVDPVTSQPWTVAAASAARIGMRRTSD